MSYDTLLIDSNGLAHRAFSVLQLQNAKGEGTSVAYGVLNMIRSLMGRFEFDEVCACWDSRGSSLKKALYPEYKNRPKRPEQTAYNTDVYVQIDDLVKVLPCFGIKQLRRKGVEADDIIGLLAKELQRNGKRVLVLSGDKDLWQLVTEGIDIYYPPKDICLVKENFEAETGVKPDNWIFYRCLIGDTSDNIKGLKGYGEVTGKKLFNKFGAWTEWFDGVEVKQEVLASVTTAQRKILQDGLTALEVLTRNYQLMYVGFLDAEILGEIMADYNGQVPTFDDTMIREYFVEKNFSSYMQRYHGWSHPFRRLAKK